MKIRIKSNNYYKKLVARA